MCDVLGEGVEDLLGGLLPHEELRVLVPDLNPGVDFFFQCLHAFVDAAVEELVGEEPGPAFETWLIQGEPVGVKCRWKRGCAANQSLIAGVLWVA